MRYLSTVGYGEDCILILSLWFFVIYVCITVWKSRMFFSSRLSTCFALLRNRMSNVHTQTSVIPLEKVKRNQLPFLSFWIDAGCRLNLVLYSIWSPVLSQLSTLHFCIANYKLGKQTAQRGVKQHT